MRRHLFHLIIATHLLVILPRPAVAQGTQTVNRAYLDTACAPCKDFFLHANGAWLKDVVIPRDRENWSPKAEAEQRNQALLKDILDSLAYAPRRYARTEVERKVGLYYRSCLDSTVTGAEQLRAAAPELGRFAAVDSRTTLGSAVAELHRLSIPALFWLGTPGDDADPTLVTARIANGGWTLPVPGYYLRSDSASQQIRNNYAVVLAHVLTVLGDQPDSAAAIATRVIALETALVRAAAAPNGSDPADENLSMTELRLRAPAFDWITYFRALGRPDLGSVRVRTGFLVALDSIVSVVPWTTWQGYLRLKLVGGVGGLEGAFGPLVADFGLSLSGLQSLPPRATMCVNATSRGLAMALGQAYVARAFSATAKTKATRLAEAVRAALRERIAALDWLGPATRRKALSKLDAITLQVGYPDRWPAYAGLRIVDGPSVLNFMAVARFNRDRDLTAIGRHLSASEWQEWPTIAFASYAWETNTVSITAAQLQPPFFDPAADDATNLATMGAIVGHELTHAFDTGGRTRNERGVLEEWWTAAEVAEYQARASAIAAQYDHYVVIDTVHQNGKTTLDENIADIGGLKLAYIAFLRAAKGKPRENVDGYTPEQRFFLAYAQTNRVATRPEALKINAETDQHSAPQWRINGALANLPEFAVAFRCSAADAMVLQAAGRGGIW